MSGPLLVAEGRAEVWFLRPPRAADRLDVDRLDAEERRRAAGFRRESDRLQYLAAHLLLRQVLSARTGLPPDRLRFGRGPYGKPFLTVPQTTTEPTWRTTELHFSLSHSHGLVAVAVAAVPVGIDVQRLPPLRTARSCLPALHPAEQEELAGLPAEELPTSFGRLWTRKEAYLKAIGTGLTRRPAADYLGERLADRPPGWSVRNLPVRRGHLAAAAIQGSDRP